MAELRVAVIGCGGIGGTHLMRWAEVSGAQVVAVCDVDTATAMRTATEFGAEAHTDWFSLLKGGGLDLLDICTPPDQHAVIARHALAGGLHVLCEKPLARTPEEARGMLLQAEKSDRLLMPAFCHRFHPPILFARELIENDDLGRIIMFRNRFSGLFTGIENRWFSDPDIAGGGSLIDTAVHSIDLFRYLVGEVASASGKIAAFNPKIRVEDSAVITLQAENGALGVIESSWATPGGRNVVELYGTAGSCFVDYDGGQVQYKTADMAVWETREVGGPDRFQREILHFSDAARGLQPPLVTARDGLRANEIIAEIYAAQPAG
jgi:predicted dehydrogenase